MNGDDLFNQVVNAIPNIFSAKKYNKVLYIEPSKNGMLMDHFRKAGFTVDCLEPHYKEFHEAMHSGLYRLVQNEDIKFYDPQVSHDVVMWLEQNRSWKEINDAMNILEDWCKLFVMTLTEDCPITREEFIKNRFSVDVTDGHILVWRKL